MSTTVVRLYDGGTIVITDVPSHSSSVEQISVVDAMLLREYARFLDEKKIIGLIEVRYGEIKQKFLDF
jgi:hypothetical protein